MNSVLILSFSKSRRINNTLSRKLKTKYVKKTHLDGPIYMPQLAAPLDEVANVKVFDLRTKLEPESIYSHIECIRSAKIMVTTTLCIHDLKSDVHVSPI